MVDKTVKDAVEDFGGVWPNGCQHIAVIKGEFRAVPFSCKMLLPLASKVIFKQQFEDYVKEQKMEKQKYKSVPVTDMTIWQLGQAISEGGEFYYNFNGDLKISITPRGFIEAGEFGQRDILVGLGENRITTRQPLPWYEVEGVFDEAKLCHVDNGLPVFVHAYDDGGWLRDGFGNGYPVEECEPLSPEEAAKYGVDVL